MFHTSRFGACLHGIVGPHHRHAFLVVLRATPGLQQPFVSRPRIHP